MWSDCNGEQGTSIADMVAATAHEHITNEYLPGYVYSSEYDMYYNAETGYYYDMKTNLYFHPQTQCYYQFDNETNAFKVYSTSNTVWKRKSNKKRAEKLMGTEYLGQLDQNYVDVCEILFEITDKISFLGGEKKNLGVLGAKDEEIEFMEVDDGVVEDDYDFSSSDDDGEYLRRKEEEEANKQPPCIRLIETTNKNALHIITIDGAKIGWASNNDIIVQMADGVTERHAEFIYVANDDGGYYTLAKIRSKSEFFINSEKIEDKSPQTLTHKDRIYIGPHQFICHIHKGTNTCADCEPGLIKPKEKTPKKVLKKKNHRQELRELKASMGVYGERETDTSQPFHDRAKERRKINGSEPLSTSSSSGMYSNCKATPIPGATIVNQKPKAVSSENKGFKLLKSMGWTEGTGLGKQGQGINAPIESNVKTDRSGLGSSKPGPKITISFKEKQKQDILEKTKQRFNENRPS